MTTRPQLSGYVYLAGVFDGCHKIGESKDPSRRLSGIDAGPHKLRMFGTITTNNRNWLERYLHMAFADRHIRGEWFRLNGADVSLILSIPIANSEEDLPPEIVALHRQNSLARTKCPGGRGRPRTLSDGAVPRQIGFSADEWEAIATLAREASITPNLWVRRAALRAAKLAR